MVSYRQPCRLDTPGAGRGFLRSQKLRPPQREHYERQHQHQQGCLQEPQQPWRFDGPAAERFSEGEKRHTAAVQNPIRFGLGFGRQPAHKAAAGDAHADRQADTSTGGTAADRAPRQPGTARKVPAGSSCPSCGEAPAASAATCFRAGCPPRPFTAGQGKEDHLPRCSTCGTNTGQGQAAVPNDDAPAR